MSKNVIKMAIAVIAAALLILSCSQKARTETFSDGGQSVLLFTNGTFTARLAHNVRKNGTYVRNVDENMTIILFYIDGKVSFGRIENDNLYFPEDWDDSHGHGNVLPRR